MAILDPSKAISRKRCKVEDKLVLIANRKSYELSIGAKIGDLASCMTLNAVIVLILRNFTDSCMISS